MGFWGTSGIGKGASSPFDSAVVSGSFGLAIAFSSSGSVVAFSLSGLTS